MRHTDATSESEFPAPAATGHIKKSTLKKQHKKALAAAKVDPYTLAYLAGHSHFSTTRRYVHPPAGTIKAAIYRVRGGHRIWA